MLKSHKFASPLEMTCVRLKGRSGSVDRSPGVPVFRVSMENPVNLDYSIFREWNARD
jgi:hypothetical protein